MHLTGDSGMEDLMWRFILWFYEKADMIFSPSQAITDELIVKGMSRSKIIYMPRGVDVRRFRPVEVPPVSFELPEGIRFLYVGRVSREKNLPLLVTAFKEFARQNDRTHLIVGR